MSDRPAKKTDWEKTLKARDADRAKESAYAEREAAAEADEVPQDIVAATIAVADAVRSVSYALWTWLIVSAVGAVTMIVMTMASMS